MLVESLTKEKAEDRLVWTLVICVTKFLGAVLYYFLRHRRRARADLALRRPRPAGWRSRRESSVERPGGPRSLGHNVGWSARRFW